MENDPPPQNVFQTEGLPHLEVSKSVKSSFSSGGLQKKKNAFKRIEEPNNITQEDNIHDQEDNKSEPEDEQENELEDEEDENYEEDHEEYQDTDDKSTVNDEIKNSSDPLDSGL